MNKIEYALAALLAVSIVIGCGIATGSFTVGYEIDGVLHSTHARLEYEYVDLNTIQDYVDHKENLHTLDNVAIVGMIENIGDITSAIVGEAWLAYDTIWATYGANGPDSVREHGTRIFMTPFPIISGHPIPINWEDGLAWMENFPEIQTAVLDSEYFVIYGLARQDQFDMDMDIDIIFTFTAGL